MREAVEVVARDLGMTMPDLLAETDLLIYGTTRATNAIVTRTVAKTAFVTTMGFPDTRVLKEGRQDQPARFHQGLSRALYPRVATRSRSRNAMSAEGHRVGAVQRAPGALGRADAEGTRLRGGRRLLPLVDRQTRSMNCGWARC